MLGERHATLSGPIIRPDEPGRRAPLFPQRATGASLVVIVTAAVAIGGVTVLHIVRRDVDPVRTVMSHYANGERGALMSVVFYAFGVACLGLGFRLRSAIVHRGVTRVFPDPNRERLRRPSALWSGQ
jgi:hypothetical protein